MGRNATLDGLKVLLAVMVVGLHLNFYREYDAKVSNFLTSYLFRLAVPIFFIINGYFAAKAIDDRARFWRWFRRIVGLYLIWALIYAPFYVPRYLPSYVPSYLNGAQGLAGLAQVLFFGYFHLWYLPATAMAGLVFYFLRKMPTTVLAFMMASAYVIGLSLQYLGNYHVFSGQAFSGQVFSGQDLDVRLQDFKLYRNFMFFAVPFFGIGLLSARHEFASKVSGFVVYGLLLLGAAVLCLEFYINQSHRVIEGFDLLFALPLAGTALFLWAIKSRATTGSPHINSLSAIIYLTHPLMITAISHLGRFSPSVLTGLVIVACLALAPVLIWLNKRLTFDIL